MNLSPEVSSRQMLHLNKAHVNLMSQSTAAHSPFKPKYRLIQTAHVLFNEGLCLRFLAASSAFSNPFVPLKVIAINMDLAKSLDGESAAVVAHLSQPFQHQAIDSCHTIPCTKCHLSYYKFSAEYSADLMGLRTKGEHWQGHLWNARRELPPSLGCEAVSWLLRLFGFDTDACDCLPSYLSRTAVSMFPCISATRCSIACSP